MWICGISSKDDRRMKAALSSSVERRRRSVALMQKLPRLNTKILKKRDNILRVSQKAIMRELIQELAGNLHPSERREETD